MARTAPRLPAALRAPRRTEPAEPETAPVTEPESERTWWRKADRTAPAEAEAGRVTEPRAGRSRWRRSGPAVEEPEAEQATETVRRPLPLPIRLPIMVIAFVFMVAFAIALAKVTLEPSPASVALTHSNVHPGRSLKAYFEYGTARDALKQIGGNILLGVPFGILVPVLAPRARGVLQVLGLTALVMLMVELTQGALITGRAFDIDDVILNTAGSLIGWLLLGRRLGRAVHARRVRRPVTD